MTPLEHVERIKSRLDAVEDAHKETGRAIRKLHKALQAGLEEHGGLLGVPDIAVYGGGTPKDDE